MEPITLRLPSDLLESLSQEADEHGFSTRSEYIRHILRGRSDTDPTTPPTTNVADPNTGTNTDVTDPATQERFEELEERVAALEAVVDEDDGEERRSGSSDAPTESEPEVTLAYDNDAMAVIDDALEGWTPGRTTEEREARRESGRAVLEWAREQNGAFRASHVKGALYAEYGLEEQTEGTWWEQTARGALNHAAERGYVDNSGRTYKWIGE